MVNLKNKWKKMRLSLLFSAVFFAIMLLTMFLVFAGMLLLDQKWSKKHIDIIFDSHEIYLYGNEELLQQVWINLIDNAIKFPPDYGTVQIKAIESAGNILVTVSDQEDGMSPDTAKHIFDKFYQGNTSHTTQGNGLGLNIADRILQLHEGKIIVKKTNNEGTDFQVSLPKTRNISRASLP